ncbi:ABC transporter ATP-binding protein [Flavivirga rizhaonensis]|uniref:ABC transporter ATP-binding protein n=1 Tax=Flavivirga rizhaonensis TaxID=2559571 RepID=A0A4S1DW78_9FLAO|nr:ABC transporter ATP-binding protein [Flavivirga rizhaonensis]TGV02377.1 ABC transporter ATP-binding protein [Flavivirga rizhaonensis]
MITINNLSFGYKKQQYLVNDISCSLRAGNIVGLLGKNGVGKSTLLRLISGLLNVKEGVISVNGQIPFKRTPDFLSDVFLVSDDTFLPSIKISDYIKVYAPFYPSFDFDKMNQILQEFELPNNQRLDKISYGQQKKFVIAFALSTNCKLILLDEPTNGLDIPSKSVFKKVMIRSIESNQLVIISTHQVKDMDTLVDKIVVFEDGKIVFDKDLFQISEQLVFIKTQNLEENNEVLYFEKHLAGYNAILKNTTNEETTIDMELLFNAIINKTNFNI